MTKAIFDWSGTKRSLDAIFETQEMVNEIKAHKENPQPCGICGFEDHQELIIKTRWGYFHQECLDDQEAELNPKNYSPQKEMDEYIKQEKSSHPHD